MVGWCGYLLLVPATVLALLAGPKDTAWQATTLGIVAAAAAWIYLLFSRLSPPRQAHRLRVGVFFIGVLALASVLMLRQPLFFIFTISGFFYASMLRPLPLAFVGVAATSFLVNTLIAGFPQTDEGMDVLHRDHHPPDHRHRRRHDSRRADDRAERGAPPGPRATPGRARGERGSPRPAPGAGAGGRRHGRAAADGARDPRHHRAGPDRDRHPTRGGRPGERSARGAATPHRHAPRGWHATASPRRAGRSRRRVRARWTAEACPRRSRLSHDEWSAQYGIPVEVSSPARSCRSTRRSRWRCCGSRRRRWPMSPSTPGRPARRLTLSYMGDVVTLDIRDDGVGFVSSDDDGTRAVSASA